MAGQRGIIHNHYVLINCHFKRGTRGWKLGIFEFDDLGWSYFLYGLAPLLGNLFDYPDAYSRPRRAFLDGYREVPVWRTYASGSRGSTRVGECAGLFLELLPTLPPWSCVSNGWTSYRF